MKDIESKACQVLKLNQQLQLIRKYTFKSASHHLMKLMANSVFQPVWITSSILSILFLFKKKYFMSLSFGILTGFSIYTFRKFDSIIKTCNQQLKIEFQNEVQDPGVLLHVKKLTYFQALTLSSNLRNYNFIGRQVQENGSQNISDIEINGQKKENEKMSKFDTIDSLLQNKELVSYTKEKFIRQILPQLKNKIVSI